MQIKKNLIILSEFESISYENLRKNIIHEHSEFDDDQFFDLKNQIQNINNKLKIEIIKLFWNKLATTQYVGFIKLKSFTIQVIPKIFKSDESKNLDFLTYMIEYLNKQIISMRNLDMGLLSSIRGNLFEYYIYIFVRNLKELLKKNIYKSYVKITKNDSKLKGKIIQSQQIKHNFYKNWKYYCEYDVFTINNLFNQIIKFTLIILKNQTQILSTKRIINEIINYFMDVNFKFIILQDFDSLQYNRINLKYKPFIDFCKLIISQCTIKLNPWNFESFYFLFDMNRLFEAFLSLFIKRNKSLLKINGKYDITDVKIQFRLGKLFNLFSLICDLVIEYKVSGEIKILLLDFKYKILTSEKKNLGISQSDFYQMFSYSQSHHFKSNNIILLYPKSELEKMNYNEKYEHEINSTEKISIFIRSIDLENIFFYSDKFKRESSLLNALQEIFTIK